MRCRFRRASRFQHECHSPSAFVYKKHKDLFEEQHYAKKELAAFFMGLKIHEEMRNKEQTFLHKLGTTLESCRLTSTQSGCSRLCFFLLRVTRAT